MRIKWTSMGLAMAAAAPVALLAFSTGPPTKRTGAPIDGSLDCSACHRTYAPANSDTKGTVRISAGAYTPGVKQTISVTVQRAEAVRWGFQLTARLASDESKQAGTFAVNDLVRVRCDTTPATDGPCNGALEFPEHKAAPVTAAGEGYTFTMDWTPPATDVGDIVFYAAGNAANNNGANSGDYIYTTKKTIGTNCALRSQPTITRVVNGASFGDGLAANTLITIFGSNLAAGNAKRTVDAGYMVNGAFPKALGCIAVEIDGKRAPITYSQGDQINLQVPTTANTGPVRLQLIANPDTIYAMVTDPMTIQLASAAPAFFTFNGKSVAAQFAGTRDIVADTAVAATGKFAKAGDVVTLYGTGFGPTSPAVSAGEVATGQSKLASAVTVMIGGVAVADADVQYVGLSPSSISGLYQLNVKVPAGVKDGNAAVVLQVGSLKTQDGATLPVKN
ncbi:MAG: hypothetical protein JSU00_07255 [Acidobacteria bacterium]|nr:hypothetical protein [Acidobacteriota bacterium]